MRTRQSIEKLVRGDAGGSWTIDYASLQVLLDIRDLLAAQKETNHQ